MGSVENNVETIKIKYHDPDMPKLTYVDGKSDFIDLRSAEEVHMSKGDFKIINLGISLKLPEGYEMVIIPRSSTFKKYGVIMANSQGLIDESYCSDLDVIGFPALAMKETVIHKYDRICQFRIQKQQPAFDIRYVDHLGNEDRGGFGSTGSR